MCSEGAVFSRTCVVHVVGFVGGPKCEASARRLLRHRAKRQFIGNLIYMYFCRGVTCKYFGGYETRTRVGHVMEFGGGSKFEADVHRLNPSATGPHDNL